DGPKRNSLSCVRGGRRYSLQAQGDFRGIACKVPVLLFGLSKTNTIGYYDLTTSVVFSGSISVCIDYSPIIFTNPANLKLFHFEGGVWVDRTVFLDTAQMLICAAVPSLSPFAILEA